MLSRHHENRCPAVAAARRASGSESRGAQVRGSRRRRPIGFPVGDHAIWRGHGGRSPARSPVLHDAERRAGAIVHLLPLLGAARVEQHLRHRAFARVKPAPGGPSLHLSAGQPFARERHQCRVVPGAPGREPVRPGAHPSGAPLLPRVRARLPHHRTDRRSFQHPGIQRANRDWWVAVGLYPSQGFSRRAL